MAAAALKSVLLSFIMFCSPLFDERVLLLMKFVMLFALVSCCCCCWFAGVVVVVVAVLVVLILVISLLLVSWLLVSLTECCSLILAPLPLALICVQAPLKI